MNCQTKSLHDSRIEYLVDEVMREEFASVQSLNISSPDSESSLGKDSHKLGLGHHLQIKIIPPPNYSMRELMLDQNDLQSVRLPLNLGGNKTVILDCDDNSFMQPSPEHKLLSNRQQSEHLVCDVCSERAGKHSYYGGQVCPSCRAFFRRSVQMGFNERFSCSRGKGSCEVTLMTRKKCQFCRYQGCIAAGMRPGWILSEEERIRRFHGQEKGKGHKAEKHGSDQDEKITDHDCIMQTSSESLKSRIICIKDPNPHRPLTAEDRLQILQYGEVMRNCCARRHDDLEPQMVTELLQTALHGTSLSHQTAAQLHSVVESRTSQSCYLLQEFQALPPPDQVQILQNNLQMIHRFRQAVWCGNTKYDWRWIVGMFIGEHKCLELENIPQDFSATRSSVKPFKYQTLFTSPWCQSEEVEDLHQKLMKEISVSVDSDDEIQIILIVLIMVFSSDFLDLEDRSYVEKTQLKFVLLLQSHFSSVYTGKVGAAKLVKALMIPALARQIVQITRSRGAL